jgi:F-type H+-transporting ATPase subunit gamma
MPTLRDIKKRIKAVQNTQKITKAMKMVAAAKFRKVQTRMFELRPYAEKMNAVLLDLARGAEKDVHPLLAVRPRKIVEVVMISADRGLCGAFNTNILKAAQNHINHLKKEGFEISISTIGKKSVDYFKRREIPVRKPWTGLSGNILFSDAQEIANDIKENYINGTIDEVTLIYNERLWVLSLSMNLPCKRFLTG